MPAICRTRGLRAVTEVPATVAGPLFSRTLQVPVGAGGRQPRHNPDPTAFACGRRVGGGGEGLHQEGDPFVSVTK